MHEALNTTVNVNVLLLCKLCFTSDVRHLKLLQSTLTYCNPDLTSDVEPNLASIVSISIKLSVGLLYLG